MSGDGTVTVGYSGDYGNQIQSSHSLVVGANGEINGYYYNPNFLNFTITPYYNQSRADSNYQSLTNASGVAASANFFTGSHFPGSVSYRYDYNSTGTFGLPSTPNFTTQGNGQGFGVNWSALFNGWPTLSVGYQQGSGSGTLYGTDQESSSNEQRSTCARPTSGTGSSSTPITTTPRCTRYSLRFSLKPARARTTAAAGTSGLMPPAASRG